MKLKISHNLTNDQLQKAVLGLVSAQGIEAEVADALLKAAGCSCDGPKEPRDAPTRELLRQFRHQYALAAIDIKQAVERRLQGAALIKSIGPTRPLTKEEIADLLQVIRDRFGFIAAQIQGDYTPPQDLLSRWQAEGWIAPDVTPQDFALAVGTEGRIIHNAYAFGRAWQAVEKGGSFAEIMKLAATMPLMTPDVHAIAIAEQQTANYITALGDDTAKLAGEIIAERNRTIIRNMAIDFHEQRLQAKVLDREKKEALGIAIPERQVNTWQGFSSELYHAMDDKSRDWDRVAFFEITDAQKQGQAMQILEQHGPKQLVYKMPLPTACAQCKHLYLEEDGTPKVFTLAELIGNGMNIGRKAHPVKGGKAVPGGREDGQETLKAVAGLVHPWCMCSLHVFTGFESWYLQKKNRGNATIAKSHVKTYTRQDGTIVREHDDSRTKKTPAAPKGHHHALVALLRKRKAATGDGKKPKGRIGHPMALLRTVAKKKVEPGKDAAKEEKKVAGKPRKPRETAAATRKRIEAEVRGGEPRHVLGEIHYVKKSRQIAHGAILLKSNKNHDRDGKFAASPEVARTIASLRKLYQSRKETENKTVTIRMIGRAEAQKISEAANGIRVDNYTIKVTRERIRHVDDNHGDAEKEKEAKQIQITEEDVARIPEVISRPIKIGEATRTKDGNRTVAFFKKYKDGTIKCVFEVSVRSSEVRLKTMFKFAP
jgi:hypothetical protein